jgi:CMP-N-acetylneuraminic acid synthetase
MVGNQPLIAYTIRDALAIEGVAKVFVSTDDPDIQALSLEVGAEVPFLRPAALASDDSLLEDAIRYSFDWYRENEGFVSDINIFMSPTHPFRRKRLINDALKRGFADSGIFNLGSVSPANVLPGNYWIYKKGALQRFRIPMNRQQASGAFYQSAFSFNIVFESRTHLPNRRIAVVLNDIESIDIDQPEDLEIARMVCREGLYPFND